MTIKGKLVLDFGDKEKEYGLSYVAFSRATCLENIGFRNAISFERLSQSIKSHKKMKPRLEEEACLVWLSEKTKNIYESICQSLPIDVGVE